MSLKFVWVYGSQGLVDCGVVRGSTITWASPLEKPEERAGVIEEIAHLKRESGIEAGWDNYSTSHGLEDQATRLRILKLGGSMDVMPPHRSPYRVGTEVWLCVHPDTLTYVIEGPSDHAFFGAHYRTISALLRDVEHIFEIEVHSSIVASLIVDMAMAKQDSTEGYNTLGQTQS